MAYTAQTLAEDAYERLRVLTGSVQPSAIPRIVTMIPSALERLGRGSVLGDYGGLQKAFAITITAGETDLSSIAGLLFDPLKSIVYPSSSTTPAVYMPTPEDLVWGNMAAGAAEPIYYAQKGSILVFRNNTDSLLTTLTGTGSVVTNYVPSLTDAARPLPAQYEGLLLDTLVELAQGGGIPAIESAQIGRA